MARTKQKTIATTEKTHEMLTQYTLHLSFHLNRKMTLDETIMQLIHSSGKMMSLQWVDVNHINPELVIEAVQYAHSIWSR